MIISLNNFKIHDPFLNLGTFNKIWRIGVFDYLEIINTVVAPQAKSCMICTGTLHSVVLFSQATQCRDNPARFMQQITPGKITVVDFMPTVFSILPKRLVSPIHSPLGLLFKCEVRPVLIW